MNKIPDKIWKLKKGDPEKELILINELNISPLLARLLVNRSLDDSQSVQSFLYPTLEQLHSPFLFNQMGQAIERLEQAIACQEKILVYGDSDVDGVTSTALVIRYLQKRTELVSAYISGLEGYGLKPEIIQRAYGEGVKLIISVDCGISNFEEAELMKTLGMDFIVLDHHESQGTLPEAVAIIDAKVPGTNYPFRDLAGVGIALKFITGCFVANLEEFQPVVIAVDCETTGLDPETAEIIEIGAVKYFYGEPVAEYQCLIKPRSPIPSEITTLTGIDDTAVATGKPLAEAMMSFLDFAGEDPLVGHNISFDLSFLKKAARKTLDRQIKNPIHDTLELSRYVLGHLQNHRLETVVSALNIPSGKSHRALPDAHNAARLYYRLKTMMLQPKITKFINYFVDLVALGTIADVVPLVGENRVLTKIGLECLKKSPSLGIRMLIEKKVGDKPHISSRDIAWGIAPIINAAGRFGKGDLSLELVRTSKKRVARDLIRQLEEINQKQKMKVQNMIQFFMTLVPEQVQLPQDRFIFLYSEGLETAITGIVANKFLDKFSRPTFILTNNGTTAIGSCRAFGNIDLVAILDACKDVLFQYGGHKNAAGYTLSLENITAFRQRLTEIINRLVDDKDLIPMINIDLEIDPKNINLSLLDDLNVIEPFGQENSYPLFCLTGITALDISSFGPDDAHLRLIIDCLDESLTAIGWNKGHLSSTLKESYRPLDIAFGLQKNTWRGNSTLCLTIEHLKYSAENNIRL